MTLYLMGLKYKKSDFEEAPYEFVYCMITNFFVVSILRIFIYCGIVVAEAVFVPFNNG